MVALLAAYPAERPFPDSSFLEVEGSRLHYLSWEPAPGSETRGRILLVHGFAASVYCWRFLGPALAELGYEVLAVDYPPFGWSTLSAAELGGSEAGTPRRRAALLWAFLDRINRCPCAKAAGTAWKPLAGPAATTSLSSTRVP